MRYDITNIAIEDYLNELMPPRPPALADLEQEAQQRGLSLVGPVQGQLLYLLAATSNTKKALEIGVTTGYAAIWLLMALKQTGGHLTGVERLHERSQLAHDVLIKAGLFDNVTLLEGAWADVLPTLAGPYDLIFLDVLRSLTSDAQADLALDMSINLLRPGGMLIVDNVLCSAQVIEAEEDRSPTVHAIVYLNKRLMSHPQLESVILPVRDGVAISRKKDG